MKEITLKIYTIDELDDDAKEKAIQTMREHLFDIERDWWWILWFKHLKRVLKYLF